MHVRIRIHICIRYVFTIILYVVMSKTIMTNMNFLTPTQKIRLLLLIDSTCGLFG